MSSDIWVEVDAEDFEGGMKEAFEEIKKIKKELDKREELTFDKSIISGGGYYVNYKLKSPLIADEKQRFKYMFWFKNNMLKTLIRRGLHPDYCYNSDGSLNSPCINLWGVRRLENTYNFKRGLICTAINLENHKVPEVKCFQKRC